MEYRNELTGLRAVAVFMVIFGHSRSFLPNWASSPVSPFIFLGNGEMGVDLFFVLSGFLITNLLVEEWNRTNTFNLRVFYYRRMLRIFPAYWVFLTALALLTFSGALHIDWQEFLAAGLFFWNYAHLFRADGSFQTCPDGLWYLAHTWSLALEEQFYLLWPAVLLPILRFRLHWLLPTAILCVPISSMATYLLSPGLREQNGIMFHTASDFILAGCFLSLNRGALTARFGSVVNNRLVLSTFSIFLIVVMPNIAKHMGGYWNASFGRTVDAALICFLLLCMLSQPTHWFCSLMRNRSIVFIGMISYSLYLWQQLFNASGSPVFLGFPANIAGALVISTISYYLIEWPFLRLKYQMRAHDHKYDFNAICADGNTRGVHDRSFNA